MGLEPIPEKDWQLKKQKLIKKVTGKKVINKEDSPGKNNSLKSSEKYKINKPPADCLQEIRDNFIKNSRIMRKNDNWKLFSQDRQTDRNMQVYEALKNFSINLEDRLGECFYLMSYYPACGKTLLANCCAKEACMYFANQEYNRRPEQYQRGFKPLSFSIKSPVFYLNVRDYIEDLLAGFNGEEERKQKSFMREKLLLSGQVKFIILDDVFTQTKNTSGKMSVLEIKRLYHWIDRWMNQKDEGTNPTVIFTSNFDFTHLMSEDRENPFYPDEDNMTTAQKVGSRIAGLLGKKYENYYVMDSGPQLDFRVQDD